MNKLATVGDELVLFVRESDFVMFASPKFWLSGLFRHATSSSAQRVSGVFLASSTVCVFSFLDYLLQKGPYAIWG